MCIGEFIHIKIPKTVRQHLVYIGQWRKRASKALDFRSEDGELQVVEKKWNTRGRQIFARPLRDNGAQG